MLRAGLVAREAQADSGALEVFSRTSGSPSGASWSRAPLVADQLNPYIRDDANYLRYGAALAMRWQLDFLPDTARLAQANAAVEELRETERYALGGIGVEVETAYAQVVDAQRREQAYGSGRSARRDSGSSPCSRASTSARKEEGDLVDAAQAVGAAALQPPHARRWT